MGGGKNTNYNGLLFENITNICDFSIVKERKMYIEICLENKNNYSFIKLKNRKRLTTFMKSKNYLNTTIVPASGCCVPDECYIDLNKKNLFIIEKKFQKQSGSVDEKLQTAVFKKQHFKKLYPNFNIHYIYCLCRWFKQDKYLSVFEYLQENNIPVYFYENDKDYKNKIIQYILSNTF